MIQNPSRGWSAWLVLMLLLAAMVVMPVGCQRDQPWLDEKEKQQAALSRAIEAAGVALSQDKIERALEICEEARAIDPESHRPLVVRGRILLTDGRLADARASYQAASRLAETRAAAIVLEATQALQEGDDPTADQRAFEDALRESADALLASANAKLMSVIAESIEKGHGVELSHDGLDEADATFARVVEVADRLGSDNDGNRGTSARLHRALITALKGNTQAAITQIEMLEVGQDYDPDKASFWKEVIRDGTLRAKLMPQPR